MDRLSTELNAYIKLRLYLGAHTFIDWLFTLEPKFPVSLKPASEIAPAICASCGRILGEVEGGLVVERCHVCYSLRVDNNFGNIVALLKSEAFPARIDYELALALKEIYHGRNCVLQCASQSTRERISNIYHN